MGLWGLLPVAIGLTACMALAAELPIMFDEAWLTTLIRSPIFGRGKMKRSHQSRSYSWEELKILSEGEKYALGVYHKVNHALCRRNLSSLYGMVAREQNELITKFIEDRDVLDAGSGFGLLSRQLLDRGFNVVSLEPCRESRALSWEWYGVAAVDGDIHCTSFQDKQFDTVIFREVVEHLDVRRALFEGCRLARCAVIIFQINVNPINRFCRYLAAHKECNAGSAEYYSTVLRSYGFSRQTMVYSDVIAFPLSGGYLRSALIPSWRKAYNTVLLADRCLLWALRFLRLERLFCWRYVLVAKPEI
jgi:2-polyprenyl-3-methyl-5-hydroxy-6-metoxy-1,4-benzoquinol methylase